MKLRILSLV